MKTRHTTRMKRELQTNGKRRCRSIVMSIVVAVAPALALSVQAAPLTVTKIGASTEAEGRVGLLDAREHRRRAGYGTAG